MMHNKLGMHFGDQGELALAYFGDIRGNEFWWCISDSGSKVRLSDFLTWPEPSSLTNDEPDMLRAFLHLASQIERCGKNKIRVRCPDFVFRVVSFDINLGCSKCLLSR